MNTVKKYLDENILQKVKFISISKGPDRNEKYDKLHFENKSLELKSVEEISRLLQLLRNESHRFAISIIEKEDQRL